MNVPAVIAVCCAVITAAGAIWAAYIARGVKLDANQRERERRDLRVARRQIADLQADVLTLKRFAFTLRAKLANQNMQTPELPRLRSEEWE